MKLIKLHFIKIVVFLLFVQENTYAQREIHPLESMFTYDYALKYYGNLPIWDYWSLENFKAPKGVKSIEQFGTYYQPYESSYRSRESYYSGHKRKRIYYYNKETGFLERAIIFSNHLKTKEEVNVYKYKSDSLYLTIDVEISSFGKSPSQNLKQYVYDIKTENLLEIRYNNDNKRVFRYIYDEKQELLKAIEDNDSYREKEVINKQEVIITYDTLASIDKIKFWKNSKEDSIYLNKAKTLVRQYQRNLAVNIFSKVYDRRERKEVETLIPFSKSSLTFSKNHISYNIHPNNYGNNNSYPTSLNSSKPREGMFLFDESGQLLFVKTPVYYVYQYFSPGSRYSVSRHNGFAYEHEQSLSILKKKDDTEWEFYAYNKVHFKKKFLKRFVYAPKVKKQQKNTYKVKNGSVYLDKKPVIIYDYY